MIIACAGAMNAGHQGTEILSEMPHICICGTYQRIKDAVKSLSQGSHHDQSCRVVDDSRGTRTDRRGFLAFAAKGLAVAFALLIIGRIGEAAAAATPKALADAYVHIGTDGSITLTFGGSEMGQGSMSGLAQILAEELMVDWTQITVQQSPVDPIVTYFTGGSSAVSGRYATLRNAGAAARELLIAAAMTAKGDLDRNHHTAQSAKVTHTPTGTVWPFSALATAAASEGVPADLRLTVRPPRRMRPAQSD
jgi:isoquinoline 1-oxidoreductase beta subunit